MQTTNFFRDALVNFSDKTFRHSLFVSNLKKYADSETQQLVNQWNELHDKERERVFEFLMDDKYTSSTRTAVRTILHILLENNASISGLLNKQQLLQRLEIGDQYFHPWRCDKKGTELEQQTIIKFCKVLSSRGFEEYLSIKDLEDIKFSKILSPIIAGPFHGVNSSNPTIFGSDLEELRKHIISDSWACCLAAHSNSELIDNIHHSFSIFNAQRTKQDDTSPHLIAESCINIDKLRNILYICAGSPSFSVRNVKVSKELDTDIHLSDEGKINMAYLNLARNIPISTLLQRLLDGWYLVFTGYMEFASVAQLLLIRVLSHQSFRINQMAWQDRLVFIGFGSNGIGCDTFHAKMMEKRLGGMKWADFFYHFVIHGENWVPSFGHYWILQNDRIEKILIDTPTIVPDIKEQISKLCKQPDQRTKRNQYTEKLKELKFIIHCNDCKPISWNNLFPVSVKIEAKHHVQHDILDLLITGINLHTIALDNIRVEDEQIKKIQDIIHSKDLDISGKILRLTISWRVQSDFITLVLPSRYEGVNDISESLELKRTHDSEYIDNLPLWGLLDYSFFHSLLMTPHSTSYTTAFNETKDKYNSIENILMSQYDNNIVVVARCLAWITTNSRNHQNFKKKILKRILKDPTEAEEFVNGLKSGSWTGKLWSWLGDEESKLKEQLKDAYSKSTFEFHDLKLGVSFQDYDQTMLPPMIKITTLIDHWQNAITNWHNSGHKNTNQYPCISKYFSAALSAHYYMSMQLQLSRFPSLVLQRYTSFWDRLGRVMTMPLRVVGFKVLPDRILRIIEGTYVERLQQCYCMLKLQADPEKLLMDIPIHEMEDDVVSIHNPSNKPYEFSKKDWSDFCKFIELVAAFHYLRKKVKKTTFLIVRGPKNSGKTTLFREVFNITSVNPSDNEGTEEPTAYSIKEIVHKQFKNDERLQEFYIVDYPGSNEPSPLKRTMQDFVTPCALGVIIMLEAKNACTEEAYSVIRDTLDNASHCPLLVLMNRSDQLLENTYQNLLDKQENSEQVKKKKITGLIMLQQSNINSRRTINPIYKTQALQEFWVTVHKNQQRILESCSGLVQNQIYTTAANWSRILRESENTGTIISHSLKQVMSIPDLDYSEELFDLQKMDDLVKSEDERIYSRLGILWLLRYNFCKLRPQTPLRKPLEILTFPPYLQYDEDEDDD